MKVKYLYWVWDERKYLNNINDKLELGDKNFIIIVKTEISSYKDFKMVGKWIIRRKEEFELVNKLDVGIYVKYKCNSKKEFIISREVSTIL